MLFHDFHVRPWFVKVHYFQVDYCIKNKNHGETFLLRVQVLTNGSGKHEYSDDVLIVKLDSVLKGASVDIIPGLIMENITDVYLYCLLYNRFLLTVCAPVSPL
jgi:hypothetical protein